MLFLFLRRTHEAGTILTWRSPLLERPLAWKQYLLSLDYF